MYRYPVVIHFHRKNGIMMLVHSVENRQMLKKNLYYENDYFGAKFSLQSQV